MRLVLDELVDGEEVDGELDVRLFGEVGAPAFAGFVVEVQGLIVPRPAWLSPQICCAFRVARRLRGELTGERIDRLGVDVPRVQPVAAAVVDEYTAATRLQAEQLPEKRRARVGGLGG